MVVEKRVLDLDDVRALCIRKNWYTKGTVKQYDNLLLNLVDKKEKIETADIVEIASDILKHSVTDYELTDICFEIAKICHTFFEEV
jgi:hypothetical protein